MAIGQNSGQAGARLSGANASLQPSADQRATADPHGDSSVAGNSAHVPPRRVTILRVAVALLLLTSAAFKVHAIFTEPYFADSILGSPVWMVGLVECEILLGLWLLSGVALRAAWLTALFAFTGFACVNVYLLATGATTCGCFGTVETHPWVMLGLDLFVFAALVLTNRRIASQGAEYHSSSGFNPGIGGPVSPRFLLHLAATAAVSTFMLAGLAAWATVEYGSVSAAILVLRGQDISLEPAVLDVGSANQGTVHTYDVAILNNSDQTITILGGTTTCKCVATKGLPIEIAPHGRALLPITIRFSGTPGPFRQQFNLLTSARGGDSVLGRVSGVVIAAPAE